MTHSRGNFIVPEIPYRWYCSSSCWERGKKNRHLITHECAGMRAACCCCVCCEQACVCVCVQQQLIGILMTAYMVTVKSWVDWLKVEEIQHSLWAVNSQQDALNAATTAESRRTFGTWWITNDCFFSSVLFCGDCCPTSAPSALSLPLSHCACVWVCLQWWHVYPDKVEAWQIEWLGVT